MAHLGHPSLLEKWLEDMPNSNHVPNVKKERKDFKDIFSSSTSTTSTLPPLMSAPSLPSTTSYVQSSTLTQFNQSSNDLSSQQQSIEKVTLLQ